MKATTKKVVKIIISLVYIIWALLSPLTALRAILDLDIHAIIGVIPSLLMLFAGIFGLIGIKKNFCRIFGIVIFILAAISAVVAILGSGLIAAISPIITALLAWLFIVCL